MNRSTRTAALSFLTMVITTTALALGVAAPASAHSELIAATPGDGEVLSAAPAEIVLEFNEDIQEIGNEIVVVDSEGTPVATGDPTVAGAVVTQAVSGGAAGAFTVTWRVVSSDGHPISGEFAYEVEESAEPTTESAEATTEESTEATTEPSETASESATAADSDGGGASATPWLIALAVAIAGGVVAMIVRRSRAQ